MTSRLDQGYFSDADPLNTALGAGKIGVGMSMLENNDGLRVSPHPA